MECQEAECPTWIKMTRMFKQGRLSYKGLTFTEKVIKAYGEVVYSPMQVEAIFNLMGHKVTSKEIESYVVKKKIAVSNEDFGLRTYPGKCITQSWIRKSRLVRIATAFNISTDEKSIESAAIRLKYGV